jgi:D-hydroxyproline dehydrogenase subunit beta
VTPDVAIVGGGIVGTATAAFLAVEGLSVTLYEAVEIAAGASGRNSGVIQHPFDPVLVGLYRQSLELYRELEADMPGSFRLAPEPAGLLLIGPSAAEPAAAGLVAAWAGTYPEAAPELVSGEVLRDLDPALAGNLVACRLDIGYPVGPATATRAYAELAARHGARIETGVDARIALGPRNEAIGVDANGELALAGAVIAAGGPWTPIVISDGSWPLIGSSWGVVATVGLEEPPRHVLEEIDIDIEPDDGGDGSAARDAGFGFSLVTADGSSALGSTFLPQPPPEASVIGRLRERGARYVPEIASAPVVATRTCARPVSPDGRPLIGPVPGIRGAYVAAGNGPWGISTGPGTARLIADLVLGRLANAPAELDAGRFGGPQRTPVPG